jgi:two-component system, NtrC family, sensor kinase
MRFQLVRHFTIASLVMFTLVALALFYFEREQRASLKAVHQQQGVFFKEVQDGFAKRQEETARRDLLAIHEAGNFNLTRLLANTLWERDFAPFVAKAQNILLDVCRELPDGVDEKGKPAPSREKRECFAEGGRKIVGLPGFKEVDGKVFEAMRKSTVFKIKVFDLRGITVYSSEHKQIGEDRSNSAGFKSARAGKPASELIQRDTVSTLEGSVENRDFLTSYLPVFQAGTTTVVGVFEVYSDVTPFLEQIRQTTFKIRQAADANQRRVQEEAQAAQDNIDSSSTKIVLIVMVLMAILFGTLYSIIRRADATIKKQEKERESNQQMLAQSEKMAMLGQMVAGVAHQLNTPLAFSQSNVQMVREALQNMQAPLKLARMMTEMVKKTEGDQAVIKIAGLRASLPQLEAGNPDLAMLDRMMADTLDGIAQMSEMVVNLRDFTRLDRAKTVNADLNKSLHTVIYIAKSVLPEHVVILKAFGALPLMECNPSQLNQVFLNLINNAAQAMDGNGVITVRSVQEGDQVKIEVVDNGPGIPDDVLPHIFDLYFTTKPEVGTGLGLTIARDIVRAHGGDIAVETFVGSGTTFTVILPVKQAAAA